MISIRSMELWVNPDSSAAKAASEFRAAGNKPMEFVYGELAKVPTASWLTGSSTGSTVSSALDKAAGKLVTFVVYNSPVRDNGGDSGGGAADLTAYRAYIDNLCTGVRGRTCLVILEPDAIPMVGELSTARQTERWLCLQHASRALTNAGCLVYIDIGDSGWTQADKMAEAAVRAGVLGCRGISSNVSHFRRSAAEHAFCADILARVKASHGVELRYVIDTSRNGSGPYEPLPGQSSKTGWCNPRNTSYGGKPSLKLSQPGCDGRLYVKGYSSDGRMCPTGREGAAPDAGQRYDENVLVVYSRSGANFPAIPE